jgi:hypothetical protein
VNRPTVIVTGDPRATELPAEGLTAITTPSCDGSDTL